MHVHPVVLCQKTNCFLELLSQRLIVIVRAHGLCSDSIILAGTIEEHSYCCAFSIIIVYLCANSNCGLG